MAFSFPGQSGSGFMRRPVMGSFGGSGATPSAMPSSMPGGGNRLLSLWDQGGAGASGTAQTTPGAPVSPPQPPGASPTTGATPPMQPMQPPGQVHIPDWISRLGSSGSNPASPSSGGQQPQPQPQPPMPPFQMPQFQMPQTTAGLPPQLQNAWGMARQAAPQVFSGSYAPNQTINRLFNPVS